MTVQDYLSQAVHLEELIKEYLDESTRLRELAYKLQSSQLTGMPHGSRNIEPPYAPGVEEILSLERYFSNEVSRLVRLSTDIQQTIDSLLNPYERLVLHLKYRRGLTFKEIAVHLGASERVAKQIHASGITKIQTKN